MAGASVRSTAFDAVREVADAILYEGYLLYPYRRSSAKNRMRWQFGVLAPATWLPPSALTDTSVSGAADGSSQQTECLLEAPDTAVVHILLRCLQLQHRSVQRRRSDGGFDEVDSLTVDGRQYLTFDDAIPREHHLSRAVADLRRSPLIADVCLPGGEEIESLPGQAGRIVRSTSPVRVALQLSIENADAPFPLSKLRFTTDNIEATTPPEASRAQALQRSLIATHTLLAASGGAFLSLLDPPAWAAPAAKACRNIRTFPVLAAERRDVMLSSPILLYDHPQVSPESPGDLFDAAEIDEILSLRTATLTDEEKAEARATDPRVAAIIDRVDTMPPEVMERLHGAVRSMKTRPSAATVNVGGVAIGKGSRVRLHPARRGADAHDIFLTGRTALVEDVLLDMDDEWQIAVTVEDDPATDLHQWYGRFYYFAPEEVSPLEQTMPSQ